MNNQEGLIKKYQEKTNEELYEMMQNKEGYTKEGKEALDFVINERGGINVVKNDYNKEVEYSRINLEIERLIILKEKNILDKLDYSYHNENEINKIITRKYEVLRKTNNKYHFLPAILIYLIFQDLRELIIKLISEAIHIFILAIILTFGYFRLKKYLIRLIIKNYPSSSVSLYIAKYKFKEFDQNWEYGFRTLLITIEVIIVFSLIISFFGY